MAAADGPNPKKRKEMSESIDTVPAISRELSLRSEIEKIDVTFNGKLRLFAGTCHPELCKQIAAHLDVSLCLAIMGTFANGETRVEIQESCRACDAYVIQPICTSHDGSKSVNDMLMEILITISALRGASANRVTAVLPIYGYARQDKKDKSRAAITARLCADMLEVAGVDRVITVDLHASQIQGFFSKPVDNLYAEKLLIEHMKQIKDKCEAEGNVLVVVSPDAGGAKRASRVATKLGVDCAIVAKERLKANEVASMRLVGSVKGKVAILVDDMADTCGTLCLGAQTLVKKGALEVHACVVHGVFSGSALDKVNDCKELASVITTNTLPQNANEKKCSKLHVLDVSSLLAEAIRNVHLGQSVSALFKDGASGH